jgi:O-antigen/teichoic acid export membrane protein
MSLKSNILWSYTSKYFGVVFQFGSSLFLARLLTPSDFGIFAVALSLIGFAHLLRDFGIGGYIVQEAELTQDKLRTAFTLGLLLSCTLGLGLFLSAGFLADFYEQPDVKIIIQIISINFFIIPFNAPIFALLARNMQFKQRTYIEMTSSVVYALVAISLAFYEYGVVSLAIASLSTNIGSLLLCQLVKPAEFSYSPMLKETKSIISYGGFASGAQFIRHAASSSPDIIMGKILGMASVGFFNRGLSLLNMANQVLIDGLRPVLMPFFAQRQREGENTATAYFKMLNIALAILWPCYAYIFFEADTLVVLLFGEQWTASIPILKIMCFSAIISTITIFSDELFKATGHVKRFFTVESCMTFLKISMVFIGVQFDLIITAALLASLPLFRLMITNYYIFKYFEVELSEYLLMLIRNTFLLIWCALPIFSINYFYPFQSVYLKLFIDTILIITLWPIGMFLLHKQLFIDTLAMIKQGLPRKTL